MVASCDTETSAEVVDDSEERRLPLQRCPEGVDEASNWNADNKHHVQPVDVLVPVLSRHGSLGDVRLLRVVLWVAVWLALAGHDWSLAFLRDLLWVDSHHAGGRLVRWHDCRWKE